MKDVFDFYEETVKKEMTPVVEPKKDEVNFNFEDEPETEPSTPSFDAEAFKAEILSSIKDLLAGQPAANTNNEGGEA